MYDPSSLSNLDYFTGLKLSWHIKTNFDEKVLDCEATQSFRCDKSGASELILDSRQLSFQDDATLTWKNDSGEELKEQVIVNKQSEPSKEFLGEALHIPVTCMSLKVGDEFEVTFKYKTSPKASAIQWLKKEQTQGGQYPFLFTQCQAIHARSVVPCQDSPSKKIPYKANVVVPKELRAVMSAICESETTSGEWKTFTFNQKVAIPSYLLALAVGNLAVSAITSISSVYCEDISLVGEKWKTFVEKCHWEFEKVGDMIEKGVELMGPYHWGRYDILVLPSSFPYGGMENPCLTFATPTIIAGDRSLTNVLAHEISHSWTGNLVTNSTWEHFWLNEGFTRFVEGKIMEKIFIDENGGDIMKGKCYRDFGAIDGWSHLVDSVNTFKKKKQMRFTRLVPSLEGEDPDDAFSSIPYEKGYAFLWHIENVVLDGPAEFNEFLKAYIDSYKFKTLTTDEFKGFLENYYEGKPAIDDIKRIDWQLWKNGEGINQLMETNKNRYDMTFAQECIDLAERWETATDSSSFKPADFENLQLTQQKINFLDRLFQDALKDGSRKLSLHMTKELARIYNLRSIRNAEIMFSFYRLAVSVLWDDVVSVGEHGPTLVRFITSVGRMKFVRPLYRMLFASEKKEYRELGKKTFEEHEDFYHTICTDMVRKDAKDAGITLQGK